MPAEPVQFFNRSTGAVESERIYGEAYLRWVYGQPLGRLALHVLVKRAWFSRWYGWRMNRPASRARVAPFIREYGLDVAEFADPPDSFRTFNEFFYRRLKPSARPVAAGDTVAVFPADGRHLAVPDVTAATAVYVKGQRVDLAELLGDAELAREFTGGSLILSRLCPVDYHRFHFPVAGTAGAPALLPGFLYSVNPIALRRNLRYLAANRRSRSIVETREFGRVVTLEVGATNVGSWEYTFGPGSVVTKGQEKGYFRFGGSLTITLFGRGRLRLAGDLARESACQRELYARMGELMGTVG